MCCGHLLFDAPLQLLLVTVKGWPVLPFLFEWPDNLRSKQLNHLSEVSLLLLISSNNIYIVDDPMLFTPPRLSLHPSPTAMRAQNNGLYSLLNTGISGLQNNCIVKIVHNTQA